MKKKIKHVMATSVEQKEAVEFLKVGNTKVGKIFVVVGASGSLAKKTIYPALWDLYHQHKLPENLLVLGYARSKLTIRDIRNRCRDFCKGTDTERGKGSYENFWKLHKYVSGEYTPSDNGSALATQMEDFERGFDLTDRIFYLAVPSAAYESVTHKIAEKWKAPKGSTRVALEKPFGTSVESMEKLGKLLEKNFLESEICRIDHHLCLDMVDSIFTLRFANRFFQAVWNKNHISCVMITFKEDMGTKGVSKVFDNIGIIKDVMQDHMLQVLAFIGKVEISPTLLRCMCTGM